MAEHVEKDDPIRIVQKELRKYYKGTKRVKAHINVGDCPEW